MSQYAASMREEASSWASAFLQFQTGRGREGYRSYAFVEDEDDKSFYQQALMEYEGICYLGCGGKEGVKSVQKKLADEQKDDGNLFLVDRDTEEEPFDRGDIILRTSKYSWESHVCEIDYVGWLLQRKLTPNLTYQEKSFVEKKWEETLDAFGVVLIKHSSLCKSALDLNVSLGMNEVIFWRDAEWSSNFLAPGPRALEWYDEKVALAVELGAMVDDILDRENSYLAKKPTDTARGKTLFTILRLFVDRIKVALGRSASFQLNSAKAWAEAMPHSHVRLAYIHDYARSRLGEV